jgi:hypothetical protein
MIDQCANKAGGKVYITFIFDEESIEYVKINKEHFGIPFNDEICQIVGVEVCGYLDKIQKGEL